MAISDKEAFTILDLPLGVDKDAISQRYRALSSKLAASKVLEDTKKLEKVVQAFHQLLPPNSNKNRSNNLAGSTASHRANDDAANLSAMHALQRKAEKKKEKKKRKKERRKNNNDKTENKFTANNGKIGGDDSDCSSYEVDEDPVDINAAFVTYGRKLPPPPPTNGAVGGRTKQEENCDPEVVRSRQVQARGMAVQGNEAAAQGHHQKAVKLFTQAASFDPSDHRFLGNRSFCYEQLKQYDKALNDADKAIQLSPDWPKGYFRRGRALLGLGQLTNAEEAFSRVLKLDPECQEAQEEISTVQRTKLTEMGFTKDQAIKAIAKYQQVQPALDALLSGEFHEVTSTVFFSDNEDESVETEPVRLFIPASTVPKKQSPHADDVKMNPRNPQGLTSLWVGNVLPEVTEKELQRLFSKYGHVSSVRQLKEKFCAFVNFGDSTSAGRAMTGLQGHLVSGQRLLIKFPDNPITQNAVVGGGARRRGLPTTNRQAAM